MSTAMTEKENNVKLVVENQQNEVEIKAYKRRWFVLAIFATYTTLNGFQWIEYSIITNIVSKYYDVSPVTVNWTSIIYMALYAPLVIPASFILDKKGLRMAGLIGSIGTAIGTSIKIFSIGRDLFWLVLLGQTILSASQLVIICLPPRLAAVWFKSNEISTACALGVLGMQIGPALGFVLTPILVQNHENFDDIASGFKTLCWGLAIVSVASAVSVITYFPIAPPKPPNVAQVEERKNPQKFSSKTFFDSLLVLMKNKPFLIHVTAYGINIGVFSAVGTLLNEFILEYFPNSAEDAGRMGLVMILVGMVGSILFGIFLDKTHKYKETTVFTYFMSTLSVVALMFALEIRSKLLVYLAMSAVGLFTNAYMPVGFEMAMELTYPSSEGTTTGLLMAPSQVLGVVFALGSGKLYKIFGTFWALGTLSILLGIGTIITALVPNRLKRQEAFQNRSNRIPVPVKNH